MPEGTKPKINLLDAEKMGACAAIMPLVLDTLQSYQRETELSGDDVVDFFALCIASVLENDTHIANGAQMQLGVVTVMDHVQRWTLALRKQRPDADAPSFFAYLLEQDRAERGGAPVN